MIRAVVVHRIAGRVRLRIPERRGDEAFLGAVGAKLGALPQVRSVQLGIATGSIVLRFDDGFEQLRDDAREQAIALVDDLNAAAQPVRLDPRGATALAFAALSLLQVARGVVLPPALTLAWYAATLVVPGAPEPSSPEE